MEILPRVAHPDDVKPGRGGFLLRAAGGGHRVKQAQRAEIPQRV